MSWTEVSDDVQLVRMGAFWHLSWRGGRVDECDGLENRYTLTGIKGSNPFPSARIRHEINGFGVLVGVPSSAT